VKSVNATIESIWPAVDEEKIAEDAFMNQMRASQLSTIESFNKAGDDEIMQRRIVGNAKGNPAFGSTPAERVQTVNTFMAPYINFASMPTFDEMDSSIGLLADNGINYLDPPAKNVPKGGSALDKLAAMAEEGSGSSSRASAKDLSLARKYIRRGIEAGRITKDGKTMIDFTNGQRPAKPTSRADKAAAKAAGAAVARSQTPPGGTVASKAAAAALPNAPLTASQEKTLDGILVRAAPPAASPTTLLDGDGKAVVKPKRRNSGRRPPRK
jgi:hypothetical protein